MNNEKIFLKGRTTEDASKMLNDIIDFNNHDYLVPEGYEDKKFKEMSKEHLWLPIWLSKTEDIFLICTGSRLWDIYYEEDKLSSTGISARNMCESNKKIQDNVDIKEFIFTDEEIEETPVSLKYLCGLFSYFTCFKFENGKVDLAIDDYNLVNVDENIYFPPSIENIVGNNFKNFIKQNKEAFIKATKDKEYINRLNQENIKESNFYPN